MEKSTGVLRVLLTVFIALFIPEKANCGLIVNIGTSQIVGQSVYANGDVVSQFLAIPYATPPVGPLRFQKPIPQTYLPALYYAFNQPPACWQTTKYPYPWYDSSSNKDEDCLYLNIWAPKDADPNNKKAVIYFIHGGGFRYGSIEQKMYDGAALAAHGDVIVVTVNYRLGSFGFLNAGTTDAPGNIGMYDILEGLKWVNKNIGAFGGDESRITIAGQCYGSIAVGLLSISPLAKGMFIRQIMESGAPAYPDKDVNEMNMGLSQKVAEQLSCANETFTIQSNPSEVVQCLKSVSASALAYADSAVKPTSMVLYKPQFGDDLLPTDYRTAVEKRNFTCNELLAGNTKDEGSYHLSTWYPDVYGFYGGLDPEINKTVGKKTIGDLFPTFPDPNAIEDYYLPGSLPDDAYDTIREQAYTSSGDATMTCPTMFYAEKCASTGSDVYYYVWDHRPSNTVWAPWMGVAHFTEVPFVFGVPLLDPYNYHPDEVDLSKKLVEAWSSFAKNGKPSIPWPEYTKEDPQFKYLGPRSNTDQDGKGFHQDNCNFFRPYYGF